MNNPASEKPATEYGSRLPEVCSMLWNIAVALVSWLPFVNWIVIAYGRQKRDASGNAA